MATVIFDGRGGEENKNRENYNYKNLLYQFKTLQYTIFNNKKRKEEQKMNKKPSEIYKALVV